MLLTSRPFKQTDGLFHLDRNHIIERAQWTCRTVNVCVCMHVCVYLCMYVCIYVCMCVSMYVRMYAHGCMFVCMYVCKYVCMYVCTHVDVCMCVGMYVHICVCVCVCGLFRDLFSMYKVVQIWPGQTVICLHTISPGHIWTTLYIVLYRQWCMNEYGALVEWYS